MLPVIEPILCAEHKSSNASELVIPPQPKRCNCGWEGCQYTTVTGRVYLFGHYRQAKG